LFALKETVLLAPGLHSRKLDEAIRQTVDQWSYFSNDLVADVYSAYVRARIDTAIDVITFVPSMPLMIAIVEIVIVVPSSTHVIPLIIYTVVSIL
jgi:hypothetical protein